MHRLDPETLKKLEEADNAHNPKLYNPNNPGQLLANQPDQNQMEALFANMDPFTLVKLDHEASKYWDERSAPKDNIDELKTLKLEEIKDPQFTFLLEILTPRLPTRFYELLPERILKNFKVKGARGPLNPQRKPVQQGEWNYNPNNHGYNQKRAPQQIQGYQGRNIGMGMGNNNMGRNMGNNIGRDMGNNMGRSNNFNREGNSGPRHNFNTNRPEMNVNNEWEKPREDPGEEANKPNNPMSSIYNSYLENIEKNAGNRTLPANYQSKYNFK